MASNEEVVNSEELLSFARNLFKTVWNKQVFFKPELKQKFREFSIKTSKEQTAFSFDYSLFSNAVCATQLLLRDYFMTFYGFTFYEKDFKKDVKIMLSNWIRQRKNVFVKVIDMAAILAEAFSYCDTFKKFSLEFSEPIEWFAEWFEELIAEDFLRNGGWNGLKDTVCCYYPELIDEVGSRNNMDADLLYSYMKYDRRLLMFLKQFCIKFPISEMVVKAVCPELADETKLRRVVYLRPESEIADYYSSWSSEESSSDPKPTDSQTTGAIQIAYEKDKFVAKETESMQRVPHKKKLSYKKEILKKYSMSTPEAHTDEESNQNVPQNEDNSQINENNENLNNEGISFGEVSFDEYVGLENTENISEVQTPSINLKSQDCDESISSSQSSSVTSTELPVVPCGNSETASAFEFLNVRGTDFGGSFDMKLASEVFQLYDSRQSEDSQSAAPLIEGIGSSNFSTKSEQKQEASSEESTLKGSSTESSGEEPLSNETTLLQIERVEEVNPLNLDAHLIWDLYSNCLNDLFVTCEDEQIVLNRYYEGVIPTVNDPSDGKIRLLMCEWPCFYFGIDDEGVDEVDEDEEVEDKEVEDESENESQTMESENESQTMESENESQTMESETPEQTVESTNEAKKVESDTEKTEFPVKASETSQSSEVEVNVDVPSPVVSGKKNKKHRKHKKRH